MYATFIGGLLALLLLTLVYEQPELSRVVAMVDYNTMLLLFSMMINVHILGLTGFFQWISVHLAEKAHGDVHVIFFVLALLTGLLSAFLDNVTCVMLIGPISISLCKQMGIRSVPFYLTQTLAATIGGAMTRIGPPYTTLPHPTPPYTTLPHPTPPCSIRRSTDVSRRGWALSRSHCSTRRSSSVPSRGRSSTPSSRSSIRWASLQRLALYR